MKTKITNYTFNAASKTITFNDYSVGGITLDGVLLIVNAKTNQFIYNFADPTKGGTVSGNVLTTTFDTTTMNNSDPLIVYYDDPLAYIGVNLVKLVSGENQQDKLMMTNHKPASGITYAPSLYTDMSTVTKNYIKSSPGNLLTMRVSNLNASKRYLLFFNRTTAPVAGNTPVYGLIIPGYTSSDVPGILELSATFFTEGGDFFSSGIAYAISTTLSTFTDSATASDHITVARYI